MNKSQSRLERLAAQLKTTHVDRANALIERRVKAAQLAALQMRIDHLDEQLESLARAMDAPTKKAVCSTSGRVS